MNPINQEVLNFTGQVAVVSGASRNPSIGRSAAFQLGLKGASVVINAREAAPLERTEADMREAGIEVVSIPGSIGDDGISERVADAAISNFGSLDLLVNTVGGSLTRTSATTLKRSDLLATLELNTWGPLALIQAALNVGLEDGGGSVVNISSGTVNKTTPTMAAYAAAKSALNALTRTLARELAPRGVRVNAVAPGLTQTTATIEMWEADDGAAAAANILLGTLTRAEDIASACVFLLSCEARQITGQVIDVDGGNHLLGGGWTPIGDPSIEGSREADRS